MRDTLLGDWLVIWLSGRALGGMYYEGAVEDLSLQGVLSCSFLLSCDLLLLWCHSPCDLSRTGALTQWNIQTCEFNIPFFLIKLPSIRHFTVDTNNGLIQICNC